MMDCAAYRRALLAEPHADDAELRAHRAACHDCSHYTLELQRFESRLERALRVGANPGQERRAAAPRPPQPGTVRSTAAARGAAEPRRRPPGMNRRRLAAAAAVLLAVGVAAVIWLAAPDRSLAADVVSHMAGEPQAWARTDIPVPQAQLEQVLGASQVRLKGAAGLVSYANSCVFRGRRVPHLVVQTAAGPVTVMVLAQEPSTATVTFKEDGYQGVIVPLPGHGSLAVLERGAGTGMNAVHAVAARVQGALDWSP
jgi:hypothetical protein